MKFRFGGVVSMLGVLLFGSAQPVTAAEAAYIAVSSDVSFQAMGEYDQSKLNQILSTDRAAFETIPTGLSFPQVGNAVSLYRVKYRTVVPEKNNRPVEVSGLIAIPKTKQASFPMLSYQHGTVFSRTEVPSFLDQSMETQLMVAQFAGNGYVVIGADYIGKGISNEPDSYMVKESTAQATYDMLQASGKVLQHLGVKTDDLFLSGWSQGAWATQVFRNRLESLQVPVKAAATASTPNDLYLLMTRWINNPTALDVDWIVGTASLLIGAYGEYYAMPGLSAVAVNAAYQKAQDEFYSNKIGWEGASSVFPKKVADFFQPGFSQQSSLVANTFFRRLQENQAYQWRFSTPTRYYYGEVDEVVTPYIATLPEAYQKAINGAAVSVVFAGKKADHRGTFVFGILDQKKWFDSLRQ